MRFDVAIVGAGIIGAACANRLSEEGFSVGVFEAGGIAGESTAAGMGHIVVMDDSEAQFALTRYSQKLWNEIAPRLPKSCEYEFCGTIWVAANDVEMEEVKRKKDLYKTHGVRAEILDERSLLEAEPNLRNGLCGGLYVPEDSVVYQLCATNYFLEQAINLGAKVVTGCRVSKIMEDGLSLETGERISADKVINAAGIRSVGLVDDLSLVGRKGHLVITDRMPGFVNHQVIELGYLRSAHEAVSDSVAFNVQPRMTEQVLIGSSRQFGATDNAIDYEILRQMLQRAFEFMPGLRDLSAIRVWTGTRPSTPDNLPYIGRHPRIENLYMATGHEGLGITTSLGTAEILADELAGRDSVIDRTPYSPSRDMGN